VTGNPEAAAEIVPDCHAELGACLGETAEPLYRRALTIFLAFERDTGHAHPRRDAAIGDYKGLLAAMGRTEVEIAAAITALRRQVGQGKV
jgi:hypothetical protein